MEIKKGQVWRHKKTGEEVVVNNIDYIDIYVDDRCIEKDSFILNWVHVGVKVKEEQGLRYNNCKPKWSLIDFDTLEGALKVFEFGKEKYGIDNWKKGLLTTEICESLMRHLVSYLNSDDLDKETNLPHVDHILCNAIMLAYTQHFNNKFDDRRLDKNKKCCGNWDEDGKCKCL